MPTSNLTAEPAWAASCICGNELAPGKLECDECADSEDRCICGEPLPEGQDVCDECLASYEVYARRVGEEMQYDDRVLFPLDDEEEEAA